MPRLPTYRDVDQTGLQNTQRVLQGPQTVRNVPAVQDNRGESIANFGSAIVEITDRIRNAQIEAEVRSTDIKTRVALDKFKNNLSGIDDESEYERHWTEGAAKIIADAGNGLSSPMARQMWKSRGEEYFGQGLIDVRDMARKRGVDKLRASLVEKSALAVNLQDDVTVSESTRKAAVTDVSSYADSMAAQGFISNEDAARIKTGLETTIAKKEKERSQLAMAQDYEDRFWKESGGDYGKASEMARAIEDPELRDIVQNRIDDRNNNEVRAIALQEEAASQEVFKAAISGKPLSSVSKETWSKLKPETIAGLQVSYRNYQKSMAEGTTTAVKEQSKALRLTLESMSTNPEMSQLFVQPGYIEQFSSALTPEDNAALVGKRGEIMRGGGPSPAVQDVLKDAREIAKPLLGAFGFDTAPKKSNVSAFTKAQKFDAILYEVTKGFIEDNNRKPNPKELEGLVRGAIIRADTSVVGAKATEKLRPAVVGKSKDFVNIPATTGQVVRFEDVPKEDVARLAKRIQASNPGKKASNWDVANAYSTELSTGRKYGVNVRFSDVPKEDAPRLRKALQDRNPGKVISDADVARLYSTLLAQKIGEQ